ncbi:hypothetical protein AB0G71_25580 [Streptomyces sp. NPDC020403]|uniref:hypothetical protein n=1 Tax=unclassified Streptomyces TaxID=2593676 RepID=UPI0033DA9EF7
MAAIDTPALPEVLAEPVAARADEMDADTVNREQSIVRKAIGWWQRQGWILGDSTIGIERRRAPSDRTEALAENQIAALWRLDVALREKSFWRMLYESAARADDVLCLSAEDLYPQDKRGKITAKGGATEWIHWQSVRHRPAPAPPHRPPPARPAVRTGRRAPAGTATLDVCEETRRARLSYRRAEEIFEENTRLLANPLASPNDIEDLVAGRSTGSATVPSHTRRGQARPPRSTVVCARCTTRVRRSWTRTTTGRREYQEPAKANP